MKLVIQRRADVPRWLSLAGPLGAVLLAFLIGAAVLVASGSDPIKVYATMAQSALLTRFGLSETIVKTIPLTLCSLAVAVTLRMKVINIGAEGQLYMGAFAASWFAGAFPGLPATLMIPGMIAMGCVGGSLWSLLAIAPRLIWGTSELFTTLMLNYVASLWISYEVMGPMMDPKASGAAIGPSFVAAAQLPTLGATRVHLGLLLAVLLAVGLSFFLRRTRWGFETTVIGANARAARYAGMSITRAIILVTVLSGGLAGLAGMTEVSGVVHRLQENISPGYGWSAIIVSALARHSPLAIVVVSFLFGALIVGGFGLQTVGVSASIVQILQGAVLLFVIGSDFLLQYQLRLVAPPRNQPGLELGLARVSEGPQ